MSLEYCFICDEPTGRAGASEDSIYVGDDGPYCEGCYEQHKRNKLSDERLEELKDPFGVIPIAKEETMSEPTPYSIDRLEQLAGSGFVVPPDNEDAKVIAFLCRDWRNRHAPHPLRDEINRIMDTPGIDDKAKALMEVAMEFTSEGYPTNPHARCLCGCERQDHRASDEACPILPSDGPALHFYEGKVWRPAK